MIELKIDPEFRDKIPPLTEAEFNQLKENILADGEVYEPICVWNGTIVDGHNRWKIVQEYPAIPFRTKEMDFADKWEAFEWMYRKQLGRRNLTDEQKTYMIGKMYEARKQTQGTNNQYVQAKSENGQNVHFHSRREQRDGTAGEIGKDFGLTSKSVRRAEKFAKSVDILAEVAPEAAESVLKGESGLSKTAVSEIIKADPEDRKRVAKKIAKGEPITEPQEPKKKVGFNKEMRNQKKLVNEVIAEMYSPELKPFTIEMLEGDIEINGQNYIDMLRSTLIDRSTLLVGDNRPRVATKIDYIISEIQKIRRLVE